MSERWRLGLPSCVGHYTCKLKGGQVVIVNYHPWWDCELHPFGELLDAGEITAFKRIPGERYCKP